MRRLIIPSLILCAAFAALGFLTGRDAAEETLSGNLALGAGGPVELWPAEPPFLPAPGPSITDVGAAGPVLSSILELRIQRNQSFYEAMIAAGAGHEEIMKLVRQVRPFRDLRKVRAGEVFRLEIYPEDGLAAFGFDLDLESWVRYVRLEDGDFELQQGSYPVERRVVGTSGVIATSLYESLREGGAPLELAAKMNDVLGWDLDFSRDPRRGDTFRIIYEENYKDGEIIRTGAILTCEYSGRNRELAAYRYTLEDGTIGYYDREGRSLQKQLMRAPLNYSRISSGFSYNRRHPVLGRNMPHLGIDYAAPVGTPVWAAGDGSVINMGYDRANGRYVILRHTNREYETYYLHFSRFARGLKVGSKVRQGEVIGYVGATGYATGPHLDFRVKKGGRFVNPRTLQLPPAEPVPADELARFHGLRLAYDAALSGLHEPSTEPVLVTTGEHPGRLAWRRVMVPGEPILPPMLEASN